MGSAAQHGHSNCVLCKRWSVYDTLASADCVFLRPGRAPSPEPDPLEVTHAVACAKLLCLAHARQCLTCCEQPAPCQYQECMQLAHQIAISWSDHGSG